MIALSWRKVLCRVVGGPAGTGNGFTILELLVTLAVMGLLGALTSPLFASYYGNCCLKAVMWEIAEMVREAKQSALGEKYFAIAFDPASGKISLVSGRGFDGEWNTADDELVRVLRLRDKGGGLEFGYGSYGPLPGLAATNDGITFPNNNTLICNPDLTGNAGTVYIRSRYGGAMAMTMNSRDFGYKLWRWSGAGWERM